LPALLRQIRVQTRAEKSAQRSAVSQLEYSLLGLMSRWGSIRHDGQWYEKVYRISGSVSNVRASAEWFGHAGQNIREYCLNLCMVAREAALSAAEAGTLLDQLRAELIAIAGPGLPSA
jgi:hypothetical protein